MALVCPACRKIYLKPQVDPETNLEIDTCPKCYGLWFDAEELSKFFKSSNLKRKFFLPEEVAPAQSVGIVMTTRARRCPRCQNTLTEKLFADVSVDICPNCQGVWLDDGELQRIVKQFEKGARNEKIIAEELSKGLGGGVERPSISDVVKVIVAFFSGKSSAG